MEPERNEVYERIPWETLEEKKSDRQWLMLALAGAIVLGALAYSFMSNRPPAVAVATTIPAVAAPTTVAVPATTAAPAPALPPTASTSPVVTAEADLYAVHPERAIDRVAAHAEWFVAEYLTVDGSEEGRAALTALMPAGVPLPSAAEGTRVFVEWVRAAAIEEIAPLTYRVTVIARSLAAESDAVYQRQAPLELAVDVSLAEGSPQVILPPEVRPASTPPARQLSLATVPDQVGAIALDQAGATEVVGGSQTPDGGWQVVVLVRAPDGVSRPVSVSVPPS
ncbi:MAG TPA: hypothetical protein VLA91_11125 [Acidimicrobiia bacterium]|nr:hypothetical protein [Acidimicrobiia bacterium]